MGFRAAELDSEEEELDNDPEARKRKALKLTDALAVLAIRPPQFDSLSRAGKLDMVRHLCSLLLRRLTKNHEWFEVMLKIPQFSIHTISIFSFANS